MLEGARYWQRSWRADPLAKRLADRHYPRQNPDSPQFVPPARDIVLRTPAADAFWVMTAPYAEYVKHAWPGAWICNAFRNEGPILSSDLIREAAAIVTFLWGRPQAHGMVTFVDADKVRHKRDPGRCFRKAGWLLEPSRSKGGLFVFRLPIEDFPAPLMPYGYQPQMALETA